ncbi:hypothetical protein BMT71_21070, partial [Escherichia coli]
KRAYCLKTQPATGETYPKSDLFNKAILLDNHGDDPLFLQEAISDMKNFMLKFSRDAFGYLEPIRNTV